MEVQEIEGKGFTHDFLIHRLFINFFFFLSFRNINRELNINSKRPTSQQEQPQRTSHKSRDQSTQSSKNQIPMGNRRRMNNEINPPEVFSTQDAQLRRKKQQNNKSKENKLLSLSGNVDLGLTKKSLRKKKPTTSTSTTTTTTTPRSTTTTTTEHPNEIPRHFQPLPSNHHRHNHNTEYNRNDFYRRATTTTQYPIAYQLPTSPPAPPISHRESLVTESTISTSTSSPSSLKLIEKVKQQVFER